MSSGPEWKQLIRFKDITGKVRYGEPNASFKSATAWEGNDIFHLSRSTNVVDISEVLAPYVPDTVLCIGLNYKEHAAEAGMTLPEYPAVFHKSKNAVNGPFSEITIHSRTKNVDYENELCVVISKDAKDVSEEDAPDYIWAYAIGNDVSAREWQSPQKSGGQFCFAKGFDGFCPFGPALVSPEVVGDPQKLKMETRRNGKVVQSSSTSDMIFGVYELISFLSQGTTIPAGALLLTGTPPGVAMFASNPPHFLEKGEVIECEIEKLGNLRNTFV